MMVDIPIEYIHALADSADQTGCDADVIVISSVDLANVLLSAGITRLSFELPEEAHDLAHEAGSATLVYREGCPQCEQDKALNTP